MAQVLGLTPSYQSMHLLSRLVLPRWDASWAEATTELKRELVNLCRSDFNDLVTLANSNHVVIRALEEFLRLMREEGDRTREGWAVEVLDVERAHVERAAGFLQKICAAFRAHKLEVVVIRSLDHWPDVACDLDLYTDGDKRDVIRLMKLRFNAQVKPRSWGDRLAHKWKFKIRDLPESVEIHIGRLGQMGEQVAIASCLMERSRMVMIGEERFRVPSITDRLMIATVQRMYRRIYFRLCDVVDTATLADNEGIDYQDLRDAAMRAGIWEGLATYLAIISDYVKTYRGYGLDLPGFVVAAARFGSEEVYYGRGFLRVPIVPQSALLYGSQLAGVLRKLELHNMARLSLFPWLATAALLGQKITGSAKGIL